MHPRRASALALGYSLAGVVLVVLLMGLAARAGPSGVTHGKARDSLFHAPTTSPKVPPVSGAGTPPQATTNAGSSHLPAAPFIGTLIRIAFAVWLFWLLLRAILWLHDELQSRRSHEPRLEVVEFEVLEDPEPLVEEMRRDADMQMELLLRGAPRNGIVACWERFEEQAERVGLARRQWETSSEFTLRLLDAVSADDHAVTALAELYREARFSEHEITEADRDLAIAQLHRIRETVGRGRVVT